MYKNMKVIELARCKRCSKVNQPSGRNTKFYL